MLNAFDRRSLLPSYPKLLLTLAVLGLSAYYPCKLCVSVRVETDGPPPAPPADPPHRLFDEYPAVVADQNAHPVAARSAVWLTVRHLTGPERAAAVAAWRASPAVRAEVAAGLFRLELRGPAVAVVERVLARYPYAVAPGERTDADLTAAYRRATGTNRFRVCVVRADWLAAALAAEPAADRLGVTTSPADADRYRDTVVSSAAVRAVFPPDGRGRVAPAAVPRRVLEAADGGGLSLFVRWATAAGAGVPVY